MNPTLTRAVMILALMMLPLMASAHRSSFSLAEAELARGHLEVALQVSTHDLTKALRARGAKGRLDEAEREAMVSLLEDAISLTDAQGAAVPVQFVGAEPDVQRTWLYFQFKVPADPRGYRLTHRLFFDHTGQQVNLVNFKRGADRWTRHFTPTAPSHLLDRPAKRP